MSRKTRAIHSLRGKLRARKLGLFYLFSSYAVEKPLPSPHGRLQVVSDEAGPLRNDHENTLQNSLP